MSRRRTGLETTAESVAIAQDASRTGPTATTIIGRNVGGFRVERLLGAGAMGEVFLMRHAQLPNTLAALKVLKGSAAGVAAMKDRFVQEALVAAAIGTHRVVRPLDVGRFPDGRPFIVLEYISGLTLAQRLDEHGPMPVDKALRIVYRVADTMAIAHTRGIVHRDLKPSNLMLPDDSDDPPVKILDFGVARAPADLKLAQTVDWAIIGSPGYMSPEAATGQAVDAKSDVFSLGATLYRMLTGVLPFPATDLGGLQALLTAPSPTLAANRPAAIDAVPEQVESLALRMLAKDPAQRPTMAELRDEIRAMLGVDDAPSIAMEPAPASSALPGPLADGLADGLASTITRGEPLPLEQLSALKQRLEEIAAQRIASVDAPPRSRRTLWIGIGIGAVVIAGATITLWSAFRSSPEVSSPVAASSAAPIELKHTRLTYEPAENIVYSASLSPDGRWLAIANAHGAYIRDVEGGTQVPVSVPGKPQDVSWFPDSMRVVVTTATDGSNEMLVVSRRGDAPVHLGKGGRASVSPSGSHIAFVRDENLWTMEPTGQNARVLRAAQPGKSIDTPVWSPDEQHLAHFEAQTIVTTDRTGQTVATVASGENLIGMGNRPLLWLADGRLIYSESKEANSSLWAIAIDASGMPLGAARKLELIRSGIVDQLTATADGKRISYLLLNNIVDAYVGDLAPGAHGLGALRQVTRSDADEFPVGFTADGTSLLVSEERSGRTVLGRHSVDGGTSAEYVLGPTPTWQAASIDPTGSRVLFWTLDAKADVARLMFAPLDGGAPRPVPVAALSAVVRPRVVCATAPSHRCVLGEASTENLTFFHFTLTAGKGAEITRIPRSDLPGDLINGEWEASPQGDRLAIPGSEAVQIVEVDDGSIRKAVFKGITPQYVTFTSDGHALLGTWFRASSLALHGVFRGAFDGTYEALLSSETEWMGYPKISADGRRLAVRVRKFDSDAWVIEGL